MLKINLIRKPKTLPIRPISLGLLKEPSIWFLLFAVFFMSACGKSDLGESNGIVAAAGVSAPAASANFQQQCAWQGGQMTTATDGAAVCKYLVGSGGSSGTSSGFSLNFTCSFSSSTIPVGTGINVTTGDTIRVQSSKSVGVYITDGYYSYGYFTVNGTAKQAASTNGMLALYVTVPSGCSSGSTLENLGILSIRVDRCLDSLNQPHTCS